MLIVYTETKKYIDERHYVSFSSVFAIPFMLFPVISIHLE